MAKDNLPEHGAGAQPSHDPQEAKRWTGTVSICADIEIGPDDCCFSEYEARREAITQILTDRDNLLCEAVLRRWV